MWIPKPAKPPKVACRIDGCHAAKASRAGRQLVKPQLTSLRPFGPGRLKPGSAAHFTGAFCVREPLDLSKVKESNRHPQGRCFAFGCLCSKRPRSMKPSEGKKPPKPSCPEDQAEARRRGERSLSPLLEDGSQPDPLSRFKDPGWKVRSV